MTYTVLSFSDKITDTLTKMLIIRALPIANEYKSNYALGIYNIGVRCTIGVITLLILSSDFSS